MKAICVDVPRWPNQNCIAFGLQPGHHTWRARTERRSRPSKLVSGQFNRLFFGGHKTSKSLHYLPESQNFVEVLMGSSHTLSPDGLNNTLLSQSCILGTCFHCRNGGVEDIFQGWGGGEEPLISQVQHTGQLVVTFSPWPPPTSVPLFFGLSVCGFEIAGLVR